MERSSLVPFPLSVPRRLTGNHRKQESESHWPGRPVWTVMVSRDWLWWTYPLSFGGRESDPGGTGPAAAMARQTLPDSGTPLVPCAIGAQALTRLLGPMVQRQPAGSGQKAPPHPPAGKPSAVTAPVETSVRPTKTPYVVIGRTVRIPDTHSSKTSAADTTNLPPTSTRGIGSRSLRRTYPRDLIWRHSGQPYLLSDNATMPLARTPACTGSCSAARRQGRAISGSRPTRSRSYWLRRGEAGRHAACWPTLRTPSAKAELGRRSPQLTGSGDPAGS
jgi:hypothetical protein